MSEVIINASGVVFSRPGEEGPTREREVFELNPSRKELILQKTKWPDVYAGTLNVKLDKSYASDIEGLEPFFKEEPVKYPDRYKSIPKRKGKYLYYEATLNGYRILLRQTQINTGKNVGIVADCNLKEQLSLKDNDKVNIVVTAKKRLIRPFFFDADKKPIMLENLYKDAHIFVISSGPSFKDFPFKNKLRFVMTMGLNNSPKAMMPYVRPDIWTCVDGPDKFLYTLWDDPQTLKLVPDSHPNKILWNNDTKLPFNKRVRECPNVVYWRRTNVFNKKTYLTEDCACWGQNKEYVAENNVNGKRSVFIATLKLLYKLGFRHVYLLGVDFKMVEGKQNYSFDQDRKKSSVNGNNATYKQMNFWFDQLQPIFLENDFHVYNLNPDSGLKSFPYMSFDDAFSKALGFVEDTDKYINNELEDTRDLYETRIWKCKGCDTWQRHAEKSKGKVDGKETHESVNPCIKCGKEMDTKQGERKG